MFVLNFAGMLLFNHSAVIGRDATIKVKSALFSLIFDKLCSVDIRATGYTNIGHLSDNLTSDMTRIFFFMATLHYLLISPTVLVAFSVISVFEIGVSSLAGISVILLKISISVCISQLMTKATYTKMGFSGERNKETSFAIGGIKTIKFNCWEGIIFRKIRELKQKENWSVGLFNALNAISNSLYNVIPTIAGFVTILVYNSTHAQNLPLENVFFVLAMFNSVIIPLKFFYYAVVNLQQSRVCLGRIENLLCMPDSPAPPPVDDLASGEIRIADCTAAHSRKTFHERVLSSQKYKNEGKAAQQEQGE